MAKKKKITIRSDPESKMTKQEQYERFKETARKLGADESGENFSRKFKRLMRTTKDK